MPPPHHNIFPYYKQTPSTILSKRKPQYHPLLQQHQPKRYATNQSFYKVAYFLACKRNRRACEPSHMAVSCQVSINAKQIIWHCHHGLIWSQSRQKSQFPLVQLSKCCRERNVYNVTQRQRNLGFIDWISYNDYGFINGVKDYRTI